MFDEFHGLNMTTIITVVRDFQMYERFIRANSNCQGCRFEPIDNSVENVPIPRRYNRFLDEYDYTKPAWFVFCHEDFEFFENVMDICSGLKKDSLYGAAGCRRVGFGGFGKQVVFGNINQCHRIDDGLSWQPGRHIHSMCEVETFDCCCLMVHSSLINDRLLRFDEKLEFDMYVEDFCAFADVAWGIKSYVLPIRAAHHSSSLVTTRLFRHLPYLRNKYPNHLFVGTCSYFGTPTWQKKLQDGILRFLRLFHVGCERHEEIKGSVKLNLCSNPEN